MQGGKILGEGVDGCIFEKPMWPCASGTEDTPAPSTSNTRYISKLVSIKDTEANFLKIAERLLGEELANTYISKLQTQCKPATKLHPPKSVNAESLSKGEENIKAWPKKGQACGDLKKKLESGKNISNNSKLMIITKYPITMSGLIEKLEKTMPPVPYKTILHHIENAIPKFIYVLQKLYQNPNEQLIHIDLHTGNIFVKQKPFEFGLADFGHCVFRRINEDPSQTFFGDFLITYVSKIPFAPHFSQIPLEARILSFCYMQKMDSVNPLTLVKAWENHEEVRQESVGSYDIIILERSRILSILLKHVLFIAMIESIQSICRKLRENVNNASALYNSFNITEKKVVEFILTRYSIISPINSINEDLMHIYPEEQMIKNGVGTNNLIKFILKGIMAPYIQDGSSLINALTSVQAADLGILWADIVAGKS